MKGMLWRLSFCSSIFFSSFAMADTTKAFFVLIGGYQSCTKATRANAPGSQPMADDLVALTASLQNRYTALDTKTLMVCLYDSAPPEGENEYVLSDDPNNVRYGDAYDIRGVIESAIQAEPSTRLFIAGHSYGGWMSMFLAETLAASVKIEALFSIDPIGPACDALGVVFGSSDCHSAPSDLDNAAIRNRVGSWVNFYQDQDSWLNSSEIPEAENHHIEFTWGTHAQIDEDERVWKRMDEVISTALKTKL